MLLHFKPETRVELYTESSFFFSLSPPFSLAAGFSLLYSFPGFAGLAAGVTTCARLVVKIPNMIAIAVRERKRVALDIEWLLNGEMVKW